MKRINITCPVCGSKAYLRPASVVYGDKAPDPDAKYYVCGRYPACDCYVAAHRKTMLPMGTLADKALRKKAARCACGPGQSLEEWHHEPKRSLPPAAAVYGASRRGCAYR